MVNRRSVARTASCGVYPQNGIIRHSVLNQHRALQVKCFVVSAEYGVMHFVWLSVKTVSP